MVECLRNPDTPRKEDDYDSIVVIPLSLWSALLNELTEEHRLLMAPRQHSRNGLKQTGRRRRIPRTIGIRRAAAGAHHSAI